MAAMRPALASLTGSKSQSSKSQSARGNPLTGTKERPPVSDENEPPLGQLSTHGGDKVSTKKKKRSSGTASKRAGGGKPLPSSRSLPPSQRSFATDETEPLNSSRLLSSSRSLAVIDELAAEAELTEAELAEAELSRSEAQLQSRDEALLEQLEAIRVRFIAAAAREEALEAAEAALREAQARLRVQPPNPLLAAVSAARLRSGSGSCHACASMPAQLRAPWTVWPDAVVQSLRRSLTAALEDNDALIGECARLRRRVGELEAQVEAATGETAAAKRAPHTVLKPKRAVTVMVTPLPPFMTPPQETPSPAASSASDDAPSAVSAAQPLPPPVAQRWATPPLAPVRYSLLAGRPTDLVEADRIERAYQGQRHAHVADTFGTAYGTPERHSAWEVIQIREVLTAESASAVASTRARDGASNRWLEEDGSELSYRAFVARMAAFDASPPSPRTEERVEKKRRSALAAVLAADSPQGHPQRAQRHWSAKQRSTQRSSAKQRRHVARSPDEMPVPPPPLSPASGTPSTTALASPLAAPLPPPLFSPRPCGESYPQASPPPLFSPPLFSPRPGDTPSPSAAQGDDGKRGVLGFPKLADPFNLLQADEEGEEEEGEGEEEEEGEVEEGGAEPEEDEGGGEKEAVAESPGCWLASPASPELTEYAPE
jgi:hypothetical protein